MIRPVSVRFLVLLALALTLVSAAPVGTPAAAEVGPSGLPLPRFVSIDSDEANLRTGPGTRYPITWVFVRRDLPVLVLREYEHWRLIRDFDGVEGWMHKDLLSGRRYAVVMGAVRTLRRAPRPDAPPVLRAEPGVIGRLLACEGAWCRLEIAEIAGWLPRSDIFGALDDESFD